MRGMSYGPRSLGSLLGAFLLLVLAAPASAQQGTVAGTVVDQQTGEPVSGAQVVIEGTQLGGLTDESGQFSVSGIPAGTHTVVVSFLGRADVRRENVQVVPGETVNLQFQLREQALRLEGLVATGVVDPIEGVRMPFSVGRLSAADMPVRGTHSALAVLQGRVAGVHINKGSGQPGTGVNIMLRTPTSIVRNNSPLYVVDGVILGTTFGGTTLDIDPGDIESIEVVKGAAAAALYGSRAAGGVVAITTARGTNVAQGTTRITARTEYGFERPPEPVGITRSHIYQMDAAGQYFVDGDGDIIDPPNGIGDWSDRVMDPARMVQNSYPTSVTYHDNVSKFFTRQATSSSSVRLSHNQESTNFVASMNHYKQQGIIDNVRGYEQGNFRMNLDHRLHENLSVSATAYHNRSWRDNLSGSGGMFWDMVIIDPVVDLTKKDPETGEYVMQPDLTLNVENPLWRQSTRENRWWRARTQVSTMLDFRPFPWFRMDANVSYDRSDITDQIYVPKGVPIPTTSDDDLFQNGRLFKRETHTDVINTGVSTSFLQSFGELDTRLTLRGLMERENYTRFSADGRDFWVIGVRDMGIGQDQRVNVSVGSPYVDIRALGYFAQLGLLYGDRYTLDALVRRDGSSLFGPANRWGTYYRFSGAWRMSLEDWWPQGLDFFTEFKPRYSRGTAGGRPNFSDQYETWSVSSSGTVSKGTLGNRFLGPEHTTEQEFGLDMIINDRFQVELTYARQVTEDQIIQIPQPAPTGYSNRWENSGTITGQTYEATLQALMVQRPNLMWDMTLIADHSKSVITEWNRPCYFTTLAIRCLDANRSEIWGDRHLRGFDEIPEWHQGSAGAFDVDEWGYLVPVGEGNTWRDGMWGSTVEIDGVEYDWGIPIIHTNEDGDREVAMIGEQWPTVNLGALNQFRFGNWTLHSHVHAEVGRKNYNARKQRMYQHVRHEDLDQSGKPENERKPIDYYWSLYNVMNVTEHFVEDATYLKLRELQLRYNVTPQRLQSIGLDRLGLQRAAVGIVGRNLLTFTNYTGFDPEVGSGTQVFYEGTGSYPHTRQFTFEVEVTF